MILKYQFCTPIICKYGVLKLNFDESVRVNKVDVGYVVRNDAGTLIRAGSFLVSIFSVPGMEIRGLLEVLVWASYTIPD